MNTPTPAPPPPAADASALALDAGADPRLWLLVALLAVLAAATLEGLVLWRRGSYDWRAWAATLGDVIGRRAVESLGVSLAAPLVAWAHANRVATLPLDGAAAFALLFLGQEFFYYWYHRSAHRVRWFWASHVNHHSSQHYNLSTALRQTWTGFFAVSFLFRLPLVLAGFHPVMIATCAGFNLI